eukprot:1522423-Amphidinium_carterae.1
MCKLYVTCLQLERVFVHETLTARLSFPPLRQGSFCACRVSTGCKGCNVALVLVKNIDQNVWPVCSDTRSKTLLRHPPASKLAKLIALRIVFVRLNGSRTSSALPH